MMARHYGRRDHSRPWVDHHRRNRSACCVRSATMRRRIGHDRLPTVPFLAALDPETLAPCRRLESAGILASSRTLLLHKGSMSVFHRFGRSVAGERQQPIPRKPDRARRG